MTKKLFAYAAENLAGQDVTAEVLPHEVPEEEVAQALDTQVDTPLADVEGQLANQEMCHLEDKMEQGELVRQAVADIAKGIEKSLGTAEAPGEGLTQNEAVSMTTALEGLRRVVGFGAEEKLVVSTEAFAPSTRVAATLALAKEASGTVAAITQGLSNTWHKLIQMLRQFLRNLMQQGARELKRAEDLKRAATAMHSMSAAGGDAKITNNTIFRVLSSQGKFPSGDELRKNLKFNFTDLALTSKTLVEDLARFVEAGVVFDADSAEGRRQVDMLVGALGLKNHGEYNYPRRFGDAVIVLSKDDRIDNKPVIHAKLIRRETEPSSAEAEIQVLDAGEAGAIAQDCVGYVKMWITANKKLDQLGGMLEKAAADLEKAEKGTRTYASNHPEGSSARTYTSDEVNTSILRTAGLDIVKALLPITRNVMAQDLTILRASLDYVQASLRTIRAAGKAAEPHSATA